MAPADAEKEIRHQIETGDLDGATTRVIRSHGPEVLGFLIAVLRDEHDAGEVFSDFSLHVWRDLPSFRWECSLRTWAYAVARHRMLAYRRDRARSGARGAPLSGSVIDAVAQEVRSTTAAHLRTTAKDAIARLRERLDPEDQALLILRVDRGLAWREVARVMEAGEPALRKRYERVKTRLRDLAREYGIR